MSVATTCFAILAVLPAVPLPKVLEATGTKQAQAVSRAVILARIQTIAAAPARDQFQAKVKEGAKLVLDCEKLLPAQLTAPVLGNQQQEDQFKNQIVQHQMKSGLVIFKLDTLFEELKSIDNQRGNQSKSWQSQYDYVRAYLANRIASIYEHNAQLGAMRKKFPRIDLEKHKGWQLGPSGQHSDRDAAKYAAQAREALERLAKERTGTSWERIAKDELPLMKQGLKWAPWDR